MAITDQVPVDSAFHAKSSGLETVRALVAKGAAVVVPVCSPRKATEAPRKVNGDVKAVAMDLGDLASVRRFADRMKDELAALHLLINNAGIMACPEGRVGPGWEMQSGVNHLGHFALTKMLLPLVTLRGRPAPGLSPFRVG